ncbi:NACHT, LRR and PYD domains-containing protein 1 homolog isoform X3 [Pseudorasbora parva]|uniref:NACHT, LRR and PYD domains-containing protein 1 homolog isoform X3 n=1 Tax=Pseudorasbora parva TaxID=51549 RepID=UPI00351ED7CB
MASVKELLVKSLKDLRPDDLRKFQWHLKNNEHIPASEMMNADVFDTVDTMVAHLGPEEAVKITVDFLRKINRYDLAEELKKKHKEAQPEGSMKASSTLGADSKQIEGSTLVDSKADLHDYTAEMGTSDTCSSHESKPSGLNIPPLLNCQSCVHIADSDQWVQIEPSACTDEGGSKFSVSTDPGRYECVRTRIRWVCDCNVTLQYRTVDGHFLNTELERLQSHRIAPVMDVTVISGKLEEVHLPHYACLGESDPSLKDAVKLLTVQEEGITTEPVQLTRFHAKIVQPSFSLKTLIISRIMRWYEHCDLLIYMPYKTCLHVYIFPFDESEEKKIKMEEISSQQINHPKPDRPFRMKKPHILAIRDVPGATIQPEDGITFRRETPPNFFKVNTLLENAIQMILTRGEDKKEVWTAKILKDDLDRIHAKRNETLLNCEAEVIQRRNMASVKELLVKSLKHLTTADLKEFQWHLKNNEHIPASEMENTDVLQTVDKMVARFGPEEAVKITVDMLRKMNQNNLAEELENKHREAQTEAV